MKTLRDLEQYSFKMRPGLQERLEARRPRIKVVEALVKLRRARSLSQRALAEKATMTQPTIARLESASDQRLQTTEKIVEYAQACGVHVGLVFIAKDGSECAVLETASLTNDPEVTKFLDQLRAFTETSSFPNPNGDALKKRQSE